MKDTKKLRIFYETIICVYVMAFIQVFHLHPPVRYLPASPPHIYNLCGSNFARVLQEAENPYVSLK